MLYLFEPPTQTAVTVAECKANSRVTISAEDALIQTWIVAATEEAETIMQRSVMPQRWCLVLDAFEQEIMLRRPTVLSIVEVSYIDPTTFAQVLLTGADFRVDLAMPFVTRLTPAPGKTWPKAASVTNAVRIVFDSGWQDASKVPAAVKAWIMMRVGAFFEHRESWTAGKPIERNEWLDLMLDRWKVHTV